MGLGGQELRILMELSGFEKKGYRVLLACQPGAHIQNLAEQKGFKVLPVKIRNSIDPIAIASFYRILRKYRVDILNTHSSLDAWTAGIAGRMARTPLLVRTRHVSLPIKNHWVYTWLADKIITTSESIRHYIHERCGFPENRIYAIPTGVDLTRFHPDSHDPELLSKEMKLESGLVWVGIIGMIRWCKGHSVFLQSARHLVQKYSQVRFAVVGFDPDGHIDFQREIDEHGLQDKVFYLGFREDIPEILGGLDILVSASTAAEGVSQAIVQGMAMERAVVATDIGGSPEVVRPNETGLLVPPNDAEALSAALGELIESPEKRLEFGARGAQWVRAHLGTDNMIELVENVYS